MNHTHSKLTVSTLAAFSSLCIATIAGLAAGQAGTPRTTIADLPMGEVSKAKILLDGDVSDWSQESAVTADANYLYFRFSFGEGTFTLQHAPKPVLVMVYADWCPTCRKQDPVVEALLKTPEFAKVALFRVDFAKLEEALPAFVTFVLIPLTLSITQGILWGFLLHAVVHAVVGRAREVSPTLWALAALSAGLLVLGH